MLEFLSRLFPRGAAPSLEHEGGSNNNSGNLLLPLPVTQKSSQAKWKKHDLKPLDTAQAVSTASSSISAPIPKSSPHSLTGFDDSRGEWLYYPFPPPPNHTPPPPPSHLHPPHGHAQPHSYPHMNSQAHAQVAPPQVHTQEHVQGHSQSQNHRHLTRTGPSDIAWFKTSAKMNLDPESDVVDNDIDDQQSLHEVPALPTLAPPAVIRMPSKTQLHAGAHTPTIIPIGRSVSSPSPSTNNSDNAISSTFASPKWNLRLNTSTHSLRLDSSHNPYPRPNINTSAGVYPTITTGSSTDLFGYAYNYPLAKQLSPIAEQDYFSPESLRRSLPLPGSGNGKGGAGSTRSDGDGGIQGSPSLSLSYSQSPSGSQTSEITRPSPSYSISHPFISRQLNRTISQTSTRTQISTTSSIVPAPPPVSVSVSVPGRMHTIPSTTPTSASNPNLTFNSTLTSNTNTNPTPPPTVTLTDSPPSIPPLNLCPPFPGPHPSQNMHANGTGPPLRPRKSGNVMPTMPTIAGSGESESLDREVNIDEEYYARDEEMESLHAESFVTASDAIPQAESRERLGSESEMDIADVQDQDQGEDGDQKQTSAGHPGSLPSVNSRASPPSVSESFISRRWNRDQDVPTATLRAKREWNLYTPAFWAFWLGFVCPVLWLVGGWHFTRFGEQPPRITFWEFYFVGCWKGLRLRCCGRRTRRVVSGEEKGKGVVVPGVVAPGVNRKGKAREEPPLPKWVTEKQSSDDGRARLHDPKRSLRGISFGYPFIPRSVQLERTGSWGAKATTRAVGVLEKPNRLFDLLYGVKLKEVQGRPESGRRMFDPWIQRCRYAFCYALIFVCVGLCTASTYLIVYNTRELR